MTTIPTPETRRRTARQLERRRQRLATVRSVIAQMSRGAVLTHQVSGPATTRWILVSAAGQQKRVDPDIAAAVLKDRDIVGVGDTLLTGTLSQTYRYWSNAE